jgi:hypothetical protein
MRDRHREMLMAATGKAFVMDGRFCLGDLIALELHNYVDACSEIVDRRAAARATMRQLHRACVQPWTACSRAHTRILLRAPSQGPEGAQHREAAEAH